MFTKNKLPQYYFGEFKELSQTRSSCYNEEKNKDTNYQDQNLNRTAEKHSCIFRKQESIILNNPDLHISEPNLSRIPSPTSSITSTKKLEWDSGADIGYNIYDSLKNSKKSKSFPILHIDFSSLDEINKFTEVPVETISSTPRLTDNNNENISDISKNYPLTPDTNMETFHKSKKRNSFKHSTPYEDRRDTSNRKSDNISHFFSCDNGKNNHQIYSIKDECLQTSLVHKNDQYAQTDDYLFSDNHANYGPVSKYNSKRNRNSQPNSNENLVCYESTSSESSFKYVSGHDYKTKTTLRNIDDDLGVLSINVESKIKDSDIFNENYELQVNVRNDNTTKFGNSNSSTSLRSERKTSNPSTSRSTVTSTGKSHSSKSTKRSSSRKSVTSNSSNTKSEMLEDMDRIPLGQIITTQHSKNLIEDIDRSLYLLQTFINSKNYTPDTKKYYAKKIVTKIIQSRYSGDSSSSSSCSDISHRSKSKESCIIDKTSEENIRANADVSNCTLSTENTRTELPQKKQSSYENISEKENKSSSINCVECKKEKTLDTLFIRDQLNDLHSSNERVSVKECKLFISCGVQCNDLMIADNEFVQNQSNESKYEISKVELIQQSNSSESHTSKNSKGTPKVEKLFVSCGVQCDEQKTEDKISSESLTQKLESDLNNLILAHKTAAVETRKFSICSKSTVDIQPDDNLRKQTNQQSPDSSGDSTNKNWRDEKTLSEKLFEAKQKYINLRKESKQDISDKPKPTTSRTESRRHSRSEFDHIFKRNHVIQYSKRERKRQLAWINNEIEYLRKLQALLQISESPSGTSTCTSSALYSKDEVSFSPSSDNNYNESNSLKSVSQTPKSLSDLENTNDQFRTEHTCTKDSTSTNESFETALSKESFKKLSKYFTNDQLKLLIKNNTTDFNCKCMCCRYKHIFKISKPIKIKEDTSKLPDINKTDSKITKSDSNENIAVKEPDIEPENIKVDRSCQVSEIFVLPKSVGSDGDKSIHKLNKNNETKKSANAMKDVDIQCTIRKHKHFRKDLHSNEKSRSDSTVTSSKYTSSIQRGQSDYLLFENMQNFKSSRTLAVASAATVSDSDFSYVRKRSSVSSSYVTNNKENRIDNYNTKESRKNGLNLQTHSEDCIKSVKPIAYQLTFEEVSVDDFSNDQGIRKRVLDKVTVKVPRLRHKSNEKRHDKQTTNKSNSKSTLQEYLYKNRPDFVEAAEWRRQCVANARESHNVFTCEEMKKITLKQYKNLPEVQNKVRQNKIENERRYNRHQANIFSRKLQRKTLQGQISLSTCISVMSPL